MTHTQTLKGKVALVAGATRGGGRGIAVELGRQGCTVYCTGRSSKEKPSDMGRKECIEDTAALVTAAGGKGIAMVVDHTKEAEVKALFEKVKAEQKDGQLDILVNDIWGGDKIIQHSKKFWEVDGMESANSLLERAVYSHMLTARYGVALMVEGKRPGLVVEITDGDDLSYRSNLIYDFVKTGIIRLSSSMAEDLKGLTPAITSVALTPGYLRSEAMLEHFKVKETNWLDGSKLDPYFAFSESPAYLGRAVAALASDEDVHRHAGHALSTWTLSESYPFTDHDGSKPHWGKNYAAALLKKKAAEASPDDNEVIYCVFDDNDCFEETSKDLQSALLCAGYKCECIALPSAGADTLAKTKEIMSKVPRDAIVWLHYDGARGSTAPETEADTTMALNKTLLWLQEEFERWIGSSALFLVNTNWKSIMGNQFAAQGVPCVPHVLIKSLAALEDPALLARLKAMSVFFSLLFSPSSCLSVVCFLCVHSLSCI